MTAPETTSDKLTGVKLTIAQLLERSPISGDDLTYKWREVKIKLANGALIQGKELVYYDKDGNEMPNYAEIWSARKKMVSGTEAEMRDQDEENGRVKAENQAQKETVTLAEAEQRIVELEAELHQLKQQRTERKI